MKKIFTLILIMAFLTLNLTTAQAADTKKLTVEWQQFPPGISGVAIIQTSDGGYLALGKNATAYTDEETSELRYGNATYLLVKIENNGNISWIKTLPVTEPDNLNIIIKTSDGGYALGGSKCVTLPWQLTPGYIINTSLPQLFLLKVDSLGNTEWNKIYQNYDRNIGELQSNSLQGLFQRSDRGFTLIGSYSLYDRIPQALFVKTGSSGNLLLNKTIDSGGESIIPTGDDGYMMIYSHYIAGGGRSLHSVKIDSDGIIQWSKQHSVGLNNEPYCREAIGTKDGGYLICGTRSINYANSSGWLAKIDSSGNPVWDKMYGESRRGIYSVTQSADGGYFFASVTEETESSGGTYGGKTMIAKIDDTGNIKGSIEFEANPSFSTNQPSQIIATSDGGCILVGTANYSYNVNGNEKFWIAKFAALPYDVGNQDEVSQTPQPSQSPLQTTSSEPSNSQEQVPYMTIGAVVTVIAALTGTCLIIYFKKSKHQLNS